MTHLGHVWSIEWGNPYTRLQSTFGPILAEYYVPLDHPGAGARKPEIFDRLVIPPGYSIYIRALTTPIHGLSQNELAKLRRQKLEKRINATYPLFADQFIAAELAKNPNYYAGLSEYDVQREKLFAVERDSFNRLTSHPNELLIYKPEAAPLLIPTS